MCNNMQHMRNYAYLQRSQFYGSPLATRVGCCATEAGDGEEDLQVTLCGPRVPHVLLEWPRAA